MSLNATKGIAAAAGLLAAAGGFGLARPAHAQIERPPLWTVTAGTFFPTEIPGSVRSNVGLTFAVERAVRDRRDEPGVVSASLRYTTYALGGGQRIRLFIPTAEYRWYTSPENARQRAGLSIGGGAGLVFSDNSAGGSGTHFACTAFVGYARGGLYGEGRLLRGGKRGEHGLSLAVGGRW